MAQEEEQAAESPREVKPFIDVIEPEGWRGTRRDLPRLLVDSFRLVWSAGRRELLLTASLQLLSAAGVAAQLFVGKAVFSSVLEARGGSFGDVLPALAVLIALTIALEVAQAVEAEQSKLLAELVSRRALDRVIDVAVSIDLLAFEEPEFYDRLRRAQAQGMFRAMQTVNGLLGVVGGAV